MEDFFIPRAGALPPWHPLLFLLVLRPFAPMSLSMTMIRICQLLPSGGMYSTLLTCCVLWDEAPFSHNDSLLMTHSLASFLAYPRFWDHLPVFGFLLL